MKASTALAWLPLLAASCFGVAQTAPPAAPASCRYAAVPGDRGGLWTPRPRQDPKAQALHARYLEQAAHGADARLVFLGDSITEGWRRAPASWAEHYAPLHALDLGISGDHVQNVAWRVEDGAMKGLSPRVLVLMIGTNNLPVSDPAQLAGAIRSLLDLLRCEQPQAKILLLGILPRGGGTDDPKEARNDARKQSDLRAVNEQLAKLADGERIAFLDMGPQFATPDGGLRPELALPDRLHLNVEGYRTWARTMQPALDALLTH